MKKSLRTVLASLLALCFMFAFAASAGAAEAVYELIGQLETVDYGNLIEYDYINKTERVIPMDSIPDYAATTTTTYELPRMASELARLAEMAEMNASMEGGASTFSIIDSSKPFVKTPPKVNNLPTNPYSGVVYLWLGYDYYGYSDTPIRMYKRGTRFMVAPDVMVTAGHCVVDLEEPIMEVRVYPYVHSTLRPSFDYGYYIYPERWICADYANALRDDSINAFDYDWCVMKLQEPILDVYNFACSYNTEYLLNSEVCLSGYPTCVDLSCPNVCAHQTYYQYTTTGTVTNITDYQIRFTNNARHGNSGGPLYASSSNICYGICSYESGSYNGSAKITQSVYNVISYYINYPRS